MSQPVDDLSERERARSFVDFIERRNDEVVAAWVRLQTTSGPAQTVGRNTSQLIEQSQQVISALIAGVRESGRVDDLSGAPYDGVRRLIGETSRRGARQGDSPAETAHGVLALREALFGVLQTEHTSDSAGLNVAAITSARLVDALALSSFETYVQGREEVIIRQNQQLLELSTPVVQLWDGIVGVPLIGTLDSARAQVVMETLLQTIVDQRAVMSILDITGVPTVDTLVAQHLLKTVTATRLMGADCIISGIRPHTAQTIVQLGIDLTDITTRATLADALATAIDRVSVMRGQPTPGSVA